MRPLIEQWLPAAAVGVESRRERGASSALPPINFLHVWWARRPLAASRAAVVASLLPAWPSEEDAASDPAAAEARAALEKEFGDEDAYHAWFLRSLGIFGDPVAGRRAIDAANAAGVKLAGNGYGYPRAFTHSPDEETIERFHRLAGLRASVGEPPVVLDPFAGGGSIPFEAARYGCTVTAGELNPVAAAILQGTVTLPARLGPGFAGVVRTWGTRWSERVRDRLAPFFPREAGEEIAGYIWAHTVRCPTTGRPTPLAPDYWLARGAAGREVAVALEVDRAAGTVRTAVVSGKDAAVAGERSTYKQGTAMSIWTGEPFGADYIRAQATSGQLGAMLLAVSVTGAGVRGRQFRAPTDADLAAIDAAEAELARRLPAWEVEGLVADEEIFEGKETKRSVDMGLRRWSDMFAPRQLLTNLVVLEELRATLAEARGELDEESWRGLGLYLAFALDKAVDYNGRLSSWHASRTLIRNTFDRHDFAFKWSFAEFDGAHSLIPWCLDQAEDAYKGIARLAQRSGSLFEAERSAQARVLVGSATKLDLPEASVDAVITDPPYYDNVMYAECSDYFYVWLKRSLADTWPELVTQALTDKADEAVANPALFRDVATPRRRGRQRTNPEQGPTAVELADRHYERLLTEAFQEAHRVLKPDGVLTVMFTHKRVDAWDTLGAALLEAGFSIGSSWPVRTESEHSLHQAKKNAASSTILLTCTKRTGTEPAWWADIRGEVEHAAEEAARRFAEQGLTGIDLTLATYGPVLSVLSRRWPVYTGELDEDGRSVVLRPELALDLARRRVAGLKKRALLGGRDVAFDAVTDWYLLAWADFAAAEFPFDEGRKLCLATDVEMDDLAKTHKVVRAASGWVSLLSPAQRRSARALDPQAGAFAVLLDALHALMLTYDEDGLRSAQAFLARTGLGDQARFRDLFLAALRAIPRTKDNGAFVRGEARVLEGLRAALFEDIPAPAEEPAGAVPLPFDGA